MKISSLTVAKQKLCEQAAALCPWHPGQYIPLSYEEGENRTSGLFLCFGDYYIRKQTLQILNYNIRL